MPLNSGKLQTIITNIIKKRYEENSTNNQYIAVRVVRSRTRYSIEKEVIELLLGENSIRVKLRMKDNIVEDFHTLMADLDLLIKKYQGKTSVPKRLAYALCDISADFSFNENFYSKEEAIAIEDMGIQIMEKVCEFYQK